MRPICRRIRILFLIALGPIVILTVLLDPLIGLAVLAVFALGQLIRPPGRGSHG